MLEARIDTRIKALKTRLAQLPDEWTMGDAALKATLKELRRAGGAKKLAKTDPQLLRDIEGFLRDTEASLTSRIKLLRGLGRAKRESYESHYNLKEAIKQVADGIPAAQVLTERRKSLDSI